MLKLLGLAGAASLLPSCGGTRRFPIGEWPSAAPEAAGLDAAALDAFTRELFALAENAPAHFAIVKNGQLVWDRHQNTEPSQPQPAASIVKSLIAGMAGVANRDGFLPTLDTPIVEVFPELAEAAHDFGLHERKRRYFTSSDNKVTIRMLLDHTGAFMDANHRPETGFYYSTVGLVVLLNLVAQSYGHYLIDDPWRNGGTGELLRNQLLLPIGVDPKWEYSILGHEAESRSELFGNFPMFHLTTGEMLKLGWLWLNDGQWKGRDLIPSDWHAQCRTVSEGIKSSTPWEDWVYGWGFWSNSEGALWYNAPRSAYMSAGDGGRRIIMFPEADAVAVFNPIPFPAELAALEFQPRVRQQEPVTRLATLLHS